MGFTALAEADKEELSYEQIILDHPSEFSPRALWYARRTLGQPNDSLRPPGEDHRLSDSVAEDTLPSRRNPPWSRDELVMALDLYLRLQHSPFTHDNPEIKTLSTFLGMMTRSTGGRETTFRNANGVYMKLMNFRRLDPAFTSEGKVGLARGNKLEEKIWDEFANNPAALSAATAAIRTKVEMGVEAPYWVFVCNPRKWAIDRFLDRRAEHDTWGVRPSDREQFAPGQLGIVRVGVDRRSNAERNGQPPLEPGVYALCEVESAAFDGSGANDEFWAPGEAREPGWPTVKLRYLRTYLDAPLTIERLRTEAPDTSPLLLDGFQAASFPIDVEDFRRIVALLGGEPTGVSEPGDCADVSIDQLAALEKKYLYASPEVKERLSKTIERGTVGALVKKLTGFKCQICEALGRSAIGFLKPSGEPYVEAHHVMPVSTGEVGSLCASNVMIVCANHHRQMHFGGIHVVRTMNSFEFEIDGTQVAIARHSSTAPPAISKAGDELGL